MRYVFIIIICCFNFSCKSSKSETQKDINVLFIGNSLTYYNDMPQMLQEMLNENYNHIKIYQSTFPGMSLDSHLNSIIISSSKDMISTRAKFNSEITLTEKKIKERSWDYIVLQTGTVAVLIPEARDILTHNSILEIKKLETNKACKFILFSTWPSISEYPKNYCYSSDSIDENLEEETYCSPEIKNLEQHTKLINLSYKKLAENNKLIKSNHTDIAYKLRTEYPNINIYEDDIHPNKNGAFLNACIFYKLLTKTKVSKLKYTASIDFDTAKTLKSIVN